MSARRKIITDAEAIMQLTRELRALREAVLALAVISAARDPGDPEVGMRHVEWIIGMLEGK